MRVNGAAIIRIQTVIALCSLCCFARVSDTPRHTQVPRFGVFETVISTVPCPPESLFTTFARVVFTQGKRNFAVDGFYDGERSWRVRFMPDAVGTWQYHWELGAARGKGHFSCTPQQHSVVHGHVRLCPTNRRGLVCDDSTDFYFFGGKWFSGRNYYPDSLTNTQEPAAAPLSDSLILSYLDIMQSYRHNATLLKICFYPLSDDGFSWNLDHIHRGEWLIQQMAARGIYCQINLFDTWGRQKGAFMGATKGHKQVLNPWSDSTDQQIHNYLRTVVARLSSYYNVTWELGNEILSSIRKPGDPDVFVKQANQKYLPWIRSFDPYDLPIGCSYINDDRFVRALEVDINFPHDDQQAVRYSGFGKPLIQNEPCNSGGADARDSDIRDAARGANYRHTFWTMFALGGAGSFEASWLDIRQPPNEAVHAVMGYQRNLADFIALLPLGVNALDSCSRSFISGVDSSAQFTRARQGQCWVSYIATPPQTPHLGASVAAGDYRMRWYDPVGGVVALDTTLTISSANSAPFDWPPFDHDMVLLLERLH
jgi:hypothetical protein